MSPAFNYKIIKIPASKNLIYFWMIFLIYFIFQFITATIVNYIDPVVTSVKPEFNSLTEEFVIAVIVAPIVETLIFQYGVIETLLNLNLTSLICIVISALLFGLSHWYNLVYVLVLSIVGFILAYYYMALRHQNYINKIVLVILLHALSNTIVFIENNFTELARQLSLTMKIST